MDKSIHIEVGTLESSLATFKKTWSDLEAGKQPKKAVDVLHFENTLLLFKTITAKRLELLQKVHSLGNTSIRALSIALNRDYKNVYDDVQLLLKTGFLIQRNHKLSAPWDSILTEISMIDKAA